jgi:hypothetical protein
MSELKKAIDNVANFCKEMSPKQLESFIRKLEHKLPEDKKKQWSMVLNEYTRQCDRAQILQRTKRSESNIEAREVNINPLYMSGIKESMEVHLKHFKTPSIAVGGYKRKMLKTRKTRKTRKARKIRMITKLLDLQ